MASSKPISDTLKDESGRQTSYTLKEESSKPTSDTVKEESSNQTSDTLKQESVQETSSSNPPGTSAAEVKAEVSSEDSHISYTAEEIANNRANFSRDEAMTIINGVLEPDYEGEVYDKLGIHICHTCGCVEPLAEGLDELLGEKTWDVEKARQTLEEWVAEHEEAECCGFIMISVKKVEAEGEW
jgi:hypothetical protein